MYVHGIYVYMPKKKSIVSTNVVVHVMTKLSFDKEIRQKKFHDKNNLKSPALAPWYLNTNVPPTKKLAKKIFIKKNTLKTPALEPW